MENLALHLPNILIAQLFILASLMDIKEHVLLLQMIKDKKIPFPEIAMWGGIALKIIAGFGLLYIPTVEISAYALIIFTAIATVIFDAFWKKPEAERPLCFVQFCTMFAVIGGLFGLVA